MFLTKYNNNSLLDNVFNRPLTGFLSNSFFNDFLDEPNYLDTSVKANITKENDKILVDIFSPGMKKDDFSISIDDDVLEVKGEVKNENKEDKDGKIWKQEYHHSSFVRTWSLPEHVRADEISAEYTDGVLKIVIPTDEVIEHKDVKQIEIK